MKEKQTAMEWLVEKFNELEIIDKGQVVTNLINQAKQMEKEQIELAHIDGGKNERTAIKYYNETFKSE